MVKKYLLIMLPILIVAIGFLHGKGLDAFYKDGVYLNIHGSGYVNCKDPESCNKYAKGDYDYCHPDSGTCSVTGTNYWIYKYVCDGKDPKNECGGNGALPATLVTKSQGSSLKVDGNGVRCGQTVQLDVFSKDCREEGWSGCETLDYMVWYSGDCPAPTATKAPTATPGGGGNPTATPGGGGNPTATPGSGGPGPRCNENCKGNPNICLQATDGCTICTDNQNGTSTCQPSFNPPTATPGGSGPTATKVPPACGVQCTTPADCQNAKDSCTSCINNKCAVPPTPTPDWDPNACKCDGWENTGIISGQPATFRVFGRVDNPDNSNAMIKDFTFNFVKGNEITASKIAGSGPIAAQPLPQSGGAVRYSSSWSTTMPQLESGVTYTVFAKPNCVRRTTALNPQQTVRVLGETDRNEGVFGRFFNFIARIFGFGESEPVATQSVQPTPTTAATPTDSFVSSQAELDCSPEPGLQLCTFKPATVTERGCFYMRFKVE